MTNLMNNLMFESSLVTTESFHEGVPDTILAEYDLLEQADVLDIPKDFQEKVAQVGDESPKYVVWAMPSGFSRFLEPESVGNDNEAKTPHRFWPEEVIFAFAEQIRDRRNGVAGYGGHAGMFDFGTIPENIPVVWVSAIKARRKSDQRGVTLARGYITRQGNYRENITLGIIDSASVSTVGTTKRKTREDDDKEYEEVQSGAALLSFDLVRKDTHGVPGTRLVANLADEESSMKLTPEQMELISKLTREQLAAYNPTLIEEIRGESVDESTSELRARIKELVSENIDASRDTVLVGKLAESFGVEPAKLFDTATSVLKSHASIIQQSVELAVKDVKNDELREQLKATILERKPATVEQVNEFFKSEMNKVQGMIEMLAGEHGLSNVPFASQSNGASSKVIASFLQQGGNE